MPLPAQTSTCPADPAAARLREQAVDTRNRAYDGEFYYGVTTTGVYCKPSCPSRRARAEHRVYFDTQAQAIAAGFRACKRCRPQAPLEPTAAAGAIRAVCEYISRRADETLPLSRLARISGFSAAHLQRTFKAVVGVSPKEFQAALRLDALKQSLRAGSRITEAAHAAGFGSMSRLHQHVDGRLGMTPSAYRAGGAGETISYACRNTALGLLMMAATDRGVCFVQFGKSEATLTAQLRAEFPQASIKRSVAVTHRLLDNWLAALNEHLLGHRPRPDLPLDVRGTAFQVRVWQCLTSIDEGEVLSYGELAQRMQLPSAVRAIASACARNKIAVLIPCHRVLRSDGTLGGYRWGLARKRALLDAERKQRVVHEAGSTARA